jgi:hypothetical protein
MPSSTCARSCSRPFLLAPVPAYACSHLGPFPLRPVPTCARSHDAFEYLSPKQTIAKQRTVDVVPPRARRATRRRRTAAQPATGDERDAKAPESAAALLVAVRARLRVMRYHLDRPFPACACSRLRPVPTCARSHLRPFPLPPVPAYRLLYWIASEQSWIASSSLPIYLRQRPAADGPAGTQAWLGPGADVGRAAAQMWEG